MASILDNFFESAFTVDNVIFGFDEGDLKVLLIKRGEDPFLGEWALPGYFVHASENIDDAANRILEELTGLKNVFLEQVKTFGKVDRHPSGRVLTVAYFSLVKIENYLIQSAGIALKARWHRVSDLNKLAFDHLEILQVCLQRLKILVRIRPVGFELLPPNFTLTQLQHLYEAVLDTRLDKRNFRKKLLAMDLLVDMNESQDKVAHRPAKLYRFDKKRYQLLILNGFTFEFKETKKQNLIKNSIRVRELNSKI